VKNTGSEIPNRAFGFLVPLLGILIGTSIISPLRDASNLSNVALLYVLAVVFTGVKFGRGPAVFCAILSSLAFAHVFVPPHFSLAITKWPNLLSAGLMLIVALLVGHLTATLRAYADTLEERANRSLALYELARDLSAKQTPSEVETTAINFFSNALQASSPVFLTPECFDAPTAPFTAELIQDSLDQHQLISKRVAADNQSLVALPLFASTGARGVLCFSVSIPLLESLPYRELAETVASLVAVVLERTYFAEIARQSELKSADQKMRFTILSSLSHDIRTPLTSLVGTVDTLMLGHKLSPENQKLLLTGLREQVLSIHHLVINLLEMAKLQSGSVELNKEWQPIEEVLGSALRQAMDITMERGVTVKIQDNLPNLHIDAVLIERVLWNLIENACKYSPEASPIDITASQQGNYIDVAICDRGPGLPLGKEEDLFRLFQRGDSESSIPGAGLGLAIARNITDAHQGKLLANNREGGGSCFHLLLPAEGALRLDLKD
jgi:two-component system sensor histidine kinase KdpD